MLARYFVIPFLSMIYASGWWAWGIWLRPLGESYSVSRLIFVPLILFSIGWVCLWLWSAIHDFGRED